MLSGLRNDTPLVPTDADDAAAPEVERDEPVARETRKRTGQESMGLFVYS